MRYCIMLVLYSTMYSGHVCFPPCLLYGGLRVDPTLMMKGTHYIPKLAIISYQPKRARGERETRAHLLSLIQPANHTGCACTKPRSRAELVGYRTCGQRSKALTSILPRFSFPLWFSLCVNVHRASSALYLPSCLDSSKNEQKNDKCDIVKRPGKRCNNSILPAAPLLYSTIVTNG